MTDCKSYPDWQYDFLMTGYIPQEMLEPYQPEPEAQQTVATPSAESVLASQDCKFAVLLAAVSLLLFSASTFLFSAGKLAQVLTPTVQTTAEQGNPANTWNF